MPLNRLLVLNIPLNIHTALYIVIQRLRASRNMNRHAPATSNKSNNAITRKWVATPPESNQNIIEVGNRDRISRFTPSLGGIKDALKKALVFRFCNLKFLF